MLPVRSAAYATPVAVRSIGVSPSAFRPSGPIVRTSAAAVGALTSVSRPVSMPNSDAIPPPPDAQRVGDAAEDGHRARPGIARVVGVGRVDAGHLAGRHRDPQVLRGARHRARWNVPGSIENANAVPFSGGLNGVLVTAVATPVIGSTT